MLSSGPRQETAARGRPHTLHLRVASSPLSQEASARGTRNSGGAGKKEEQSFILSLRACFFFFLKKMFAARLKPTHRQRCSWDSEAEEKRTYIRSDSLDWFKCNAVIWTPVLPSQTPWWTGCPETCGSRSPPSCPPCLSSQTFGGYAAQCAMTGTFYTNKNKEFSVCMQKPGSRLSFAGFRCVLLDGSFRELGCDGG